MSWIYVQIPAYHDAELWPTLKSLYAQAARPERLRVRVLWQHGPEERAPDAIRRLPRLELIPVPARSSQGCNWARHHLQQGWAGEQYTLLLDSHHRFVRGWDVQARAMLEAVKTKDGERPLLTAYLPAYVPDFFQRRRKRPYKIYPIGREDGILTRLISLPIRNYSKLDAPIKADFVSLHFVFASGEFNRDVPMDPRIYFFGDEVRTSLFAYAAGFRFYHPHRVLGWHAYDRGARRPHWADHADWIRRNRASMARLRRLYRSGSHIGASGVKVSEFEAYSGVTLALR